MKQSQTLLLLLCCLSVSSTMKQINHCEMKTSNLHLINIIDILQFGKHLNLNKTCNYINGFLSVAIQSSDSETEVDQLFMLLNKVEVITDYLYVKIVKNKITKFSMKSLTTILGKTLVENNEYSLLFTNCHDDFHDFEFPNLKLIANGKVGFLLSKNLCNAANLIYWPEILSNPELQKVEVHEYQGCDKRQSICHRKCLPLNGNQIYCYGPNEDQCQIASKCRVRPVRGDSRCYRHGDNEDYCNDECNGGCTGIDAKDCFACKNKWYNGECVSSCPSDTYDYNNICLKQCPAGYLIAESHCVLACADDYHIVNKTCQPCTENLCENSKRCNGTTSDITKDDLDSFINCTHLYGSVIINHSSFKTIKSLDAFEVFSSLKYVKGNLYLDFSKADRTHILKNPKFQSLYFFKNLVKIGGTGHDENNKLQSTLASMPITYLGLTSLQHFGVNKLQIFNCSNLTYATTVNWTKLGVIETRIARTPNTSAKQLCDAECDPDWGCWGPGPYQCVRCANRRISTENLCINDCEKTDKYFNPNTNASHSACQLCDSQCQGGCRGPGPKQCNSCRNLKILETGECVSHGQVFLLESFIDSDNLTTRERIKEILPKDSRCPDEYYSKLINPENKNKLDPLDSVFKNDISDVDISVLCRKCAPFCKHCSSYSKCHYCEGQWQELGMCVGRCNHDKLPEIYKQNNFASNDSCPSCHPLCSGGCYNVSESDCKSCRHFYVNKTSNVPNKMIITCVDECPEGMYPQSNRLCVNEPVAIVTASLSVVSAVILLVLGMILIIFVIQNKKKKQKEMLNNLFNNGYFPVDAIEGFYSPNLNRLEIINMNDLSYNRNDSSRLGSGAFGDVYFGKWRLTEEQKSRREEELAAFQVPNAFSSVAKGKQYLEMDVAIKFLAENASNNLDDFFAETKVMASVKHPYCLPLIGVCITDNNRSLITAYMPLGSMKHYLSNTPICDIDPSRLILWSYQIADGMNYLSKIGIIHRDLATRNVLLKDTQWAMITDFGLSAMLEKENEKEIIIKGGALPIRWVAVEIIRNRVYSEKSDVWSFGVTLWEIFTHGQTPYKQLKNNEIVNYVLNGSRLECPLGCKPPLYQLMTSCWYDDPECRPTFANLESQLKTFLDKPKDYFRLPQNQSAVAMRKAKTPVDVGNISFDAKNESVYLPMSPSTKESAFVRQSDLSYKEGPIPSHYNPMESFDFNISTEGQN